MERDPGGFASACKSSISFALDCISVGFRTVTALPSLTGTAWRLVLEIFAISTVYGLFAVIIISAFNMQISVPHANREMLLRLAIVPLALACGYRSAVTLGVVAKRAATLWRKNAVDPVEIRAFAENRWRRLLLSDWTTLVGLLSPFAVYFYGVKALETGRFGVPIACLEFIVSTLISVFSSLLVTKIVDADISLQQAVGSVWALVCRRPAELAALVAVYAVGTEIFGVVAAGAEGWLAALHLPHLYIQLLKVLLFGFVLVYLRYFEFTIQCTWSWALFRLERESNVTISKSPADF